jgi:very-short-patch-repair endonuclease
MPEPQHWIRTPAGWVRVDFYWDQHLLIGEVDGMVKYVAKSDLVEEKLRQERLEEQRAVIRWTWAQAVLSTDEQLLARLNAAFVRGDRLRTLLNV